ncbi:MAG: hypothetical protein Q9166_007404 [cf. Caloplaca sp. 2 TL-2023]
MAHWLPALFGCNILYTCDPEAASQLFRSSAFDKPANLMKILNIYGPTMTGVINQESKLYRNTVTPFFNHRTMDKVWNSATDGAEAALKVLATEKEEHRVIKDLRPILARLTFYLLNVVCFDYGGGGCVLELEDKGFVPRGRKMSHTKAMHIFLDQLPTLSLTPPVLLSPSFASQAHKVYTELRGYIERVRDGKLIEMRTASKKAKSPHDLNIAGENSSFPGPKYAKEASIDLIVGASDFEGTVPNPALPPEAVLGNLFIFMFAGHEANANAILFVIILLACNPGIQ